MFISRKRWQALVKRIADLEAQVQGQQKGTMSYTENGKLMRTHGKSALTM